MTDVNQRLAAALRPFFPEDSDAEYLADILLSPTPITQRLNVLERGQAFRETVEALPEATQPWREALEELLDDWARDNPDPRVFEPARARVRALLAGESND